MSVIQNRNRGDQGQVAVDVGGRLRNIEPAYYKPVSPSPVSDHLKTPSEPVGWKAPVVMRGQRRIGMRYLYAHGAVEQPISPLGTGPDVGQAVWSSAFQPDLTGPIHDAGFNDALFQAGYPGFNLGLSFKVQKLPVNSTGGPGTNMRMRSSNIRILINRNIRASSQISTTG